MVDYSYPEAAWPAPYALTAGDYGYIWYVRTNPETPPQPIGVYDHPPPPGSDIRYVRVSGSLPFVPELLKTTHYYYKLTRAIGHLLDGL